MELRRAPNPKNQPATWDPVRMRLVPSAVDLPAFLFTLPSRKTAPPCHPGSYKMPPPPKTQAATWDPVRVRLVPSAVDLPAFLFPPLRASGDRES